MQNIVMKNKLSLLIILLSFLASCSSNKSLTKVSKDYSKLTKEELEAKKEKIEIDLNHEIAVKYLEFLGVRNIAPALGKYGWKKVEEYWASNPDLKKDRLEFEISDKKLRDFIIEKDNRKSVAYEKLKRKEISKNDFLKVKSEVFKSLELKYPKEYGELRKDRDSKLGKSNRKTLEFIIADYHSKKLLFPINWIPDKELTRIKKDRYIKARIIEIDKIETELINRI